MKKGNTYAIALGGLLVTTSAQAALTLTGVTTAPSNAQISQADSNTNIGTSSGTGSAVGQTFTTGGAFGMTGLTLIKGANQSYTATGNASVRLQIFEWNPAGDANVTTNWTDAPQGGSSISGMTSLYNETMDFQGLSFTGGTDHLNFDLGTTLSLSATTAYGFLVTMEGVTGGADNINFRQATSPSNPYADGLRLNNDSTTNSFGSNQDLAFYVVPEPSSTVFLGLGGLALVLRRRRGCAI
ncbi:PEP-CTERM sorting domain-containing protein [Haloferula sp.]|uniref:PEP-CTERM sorting domain-containing protein n=1 Tax=Haloferula sp. TaxID=2497595 RepID=UPI00329E444F